MSVVAGKAALWKQVVVVAAGSTTFTITPTSGKVTISHVDDAGVRQYWSGSAWGTTSTEITTTISGTESRYTLAAAATNNLEGKDIRFEGYINGDKATLDASDETVIPEQGAAGATVKGL